MIKGIEHLGLVAEDSAKLVKWYQEHLQMKVIRENGKGTYFIQGPGGIIIEVYQARNETERKYDNYTPGWRHLAIQVVGFDDEYQRLLDQGVEPAADPILREDLKLALFKDCEGNLFHLIERKNPLK